MINSFKNNTEERIKEKLMDLKTDQIELINIILNIAISEFKELMDNYEGYSKIEKKINNIIKQNHL